MDKVTKVITDIPKPDWDSLERRAKEENRSAMGQFRSMLKKWAEEERLAKK